MVMKIDDTFGNLVKRAWKSIYELNEKKTTQTNLHQWGRKEGDYP